MVILSHLVHLALRMVSAGGAFLVAAHFLPGMHVATWLAALQGAVALGVLNAVVRPILGFLTVPITVLTLGLFGFVLNGLMLVLTDYFLDGIRVDNFLWAIAGSVVIGMINALVHILIP